MEIQGKLASLVNRAFFTFPSTSNIHNVDDDDDVCADSSLPLGALTMRFAKVSSDRLITSEWKEESERKAVQG